MKTIQLSGITAGLGALSFAKKLRRFNEQKSVPGVNPEHQDKFIANQIKMKVAAKAGISPKKVIKKK